MTCLFSVVVPPQRAEKVQHTPKPPAHIPVEIPPLSSSTSQIQGFVNVQKKKTPKVKFGYLNQNRFFIFS